MAGCGGSDSDVEIVFLSLRAVTGVVCDDWVA